MTEQLAGDDAIADLMAKLERSDDAAPVEALLAEFPEDPRLHFMRGSLLVKGQNPTEAHRSMKRAVELAPGFAIARYQLGFFELTSGDAESALATWGPLLASAEDDYLRVFVEGMVHLIRDEFDPAIAKFEQGLALNKDNEPLNNDIRLLMKEVRELAHRQSSGDDGDALSATSLMLGQFSGNRTIN